MSIDHTPIQRFCPFYPLYISTLLKHHMHQCFLLILVVSGLLGCVRQGQYEFIQHQYNQSQNRIKDLEQKWTHEKNKVKSLQGYKVVIEKDLTHQKEQLQLNLEKQKKLQAQLDDMQFALHEKQKDETTQRLKKQSFRAQANRFQDLVKQTGGQLFVSDEQFKIVLAIDLFFDRGSLVWSSWQNEGIKRLSEVLKTFPDWFIRLDVHCDDQTSSVVGSLYNLTSQQALLMADQMAFYGVKRSHILTVGLGADYPTDVEFFKSAVSITPPPKEGEKQKVVEPVQAAQINSLKKKSEKKKSEKKRSKKKKSNPNETPAPIQPKLIQDATLRHRRLEIHLFPKKPQTTTSFLLPFPSVHALTPNHSLGNASEKASPNMIPQVKPSFTPSPSTQSSISSSHEQTQHSTSKEREKRQSKEKKESQRESSPKNPSSLSKSPKP